MKSNIQNNDPSDTMVYPGQENIPAMLEVMVTTAQRTIWKGAAFNSEQSEEIRRLISLKLKNCAKPYAYYRQLVTEIICLYRNHNGKRSRIIFPDRLKEMHTLQNHHPTSYHPLADALLSITEYPSKENVQYWISWFRQRKFVSDIQMLYIIFPHLFNQQQ